MYVENKLGELRTVEIPIADLPAVLTFPVLPQPALLTGKRVETYDAWGVTLNPEKLKRWASQRIYLGAIDLIKFSRFMAKIAHAQLVSDLGVDGFTPTLIDSILGTHPYPQDFIGTFEMEAPAVEMLHLRQHVIVESEGKKFHGVRIRLFCYFGTPEYIVLAGT